MVSYLRLVSDIPRLSTLDNFNGDDKMDLNVQNNDDIVGHAIKGKDERAEIFYGRIDKAYQRNIRSIEFLKGIVKESEGRISFGLNNLIISGKLASYCIPTERLMSILSNPLDDAIEGSFGMPYVECHPRVRWIHRPQHACIQMGETNQEVAPLDTLCSVLMGLLNDDKMFLDLESGDTLRTALLRLYGLDFSPISNSLTQLLWDTSDASMNLEKSEIIVPGTDGFTWHLSFNDPQCHGFSLSISGNGIGSEPITLMRDTSDPESQDAVDFEEIDMRARRDDFWTLVNHMPYLPAALYNESISLETLQSTNINECCNINPDWHGNCLNEPWFRTLLEKSAPQIDWASEVTILSQCSNCGLFGVKSRTNTCVECETKQE